MNTGLLPPSLWSTLTNRECEIRQSRLIGPATSCYIHELVRKCAQTAECRQAVKHHQHLESSIEGMVDILVDWELHRRQTAMAAQQNQLAIRIYIKDLGARARRVSFSRHLESEEVRLHNQHIEVYDQLRRRAITYAGP